MTARARSEPPRPLRLHLSSARRDPRDPTAAIKSTSRMLWELLQAEARAAGADEAVLLSTRDEVLESATGNLFCLVDGRLATPAFDGSFLPGIARAILLESCGRAGIRVDERPLGADELRRAERIWSSNAVHGPRPAVILDGAPPAPVENRDDLLARVWPGDFPDRPGLSQPAPACR